MSNIKIIICAHKEVPLPQHPYFLPVQAGAALHEHIKGYQWKSNTNNEVIISKDDTNFSLNTLLYIVIAPSNPLNFTNKDNSKSSGDKLISKFYIGIISEDVPFSVTEGMPHTMTLSNSYSQQMYLNLIGIRNFLIHTFQLKNYILLFQYLNYLHLLQ